MAKVHLEREFIEEMFPYMRNYNNLPRKKKKVLKKRLSDEINRAITAFIQSNEDLLTL